MKRMRKERRAIFKRTPAVEAGVEPVTQTLQRVPTRISNRHCSSADVDTKKCRLSLELNKDDAVYDVGQNIGGSAVVHADEKVEIIGLELRLYGGSVVRWVDRKKGLRGRKARDERSAEEVYFNYSQTLWGKVRGAKPEEPELLSEGRHLFPFSWTLPEDVPCAYEGPYGWVRYYAMCTLYLPGCRPGCHTTYSTQVFFTVINQVDLNTDKGVLLPVKQQKELVLTTPVCQTGRVVCTLSLPRSGFVPGEHLPTEVEIHNASPRKVKDVLVSLQQIVEYSSRDDEHTKRKIWQVAKVRGDCIKAGKRHYWRTRGLIIPPIAPSALDGSKYIDIKYEAKLYIDVAPHWMVVTIPITIGTVPIVDAFLTIWKYIGSAGAETAYSPRHTNRKSLITSLLSWSSFSSWWWIAKCIVFKILTLTIVPPSVTLSLTTVKTQ